MESDYPFKVLRSPICSYEDIWFMIFLRFPVKALCLFSCVCKSWKSIISSPLFIAHHFSNASAKCTKKSYLLLNGRRNAHKPYALYRPERPIPQRINFLHFPFEIRYRNPDPINFKIIDFVHGLACLVPPVKFSQCAFLWNPSIHKYVNVPWSPINVQSSEYIGFGFDSSRGDFKLVSISHTWQTENELQPIYQLFSLKSGQWKQLTADNVGSLRVISCYNSCYVNGAIHWLAARTRKPWNYIYTYELLVFDCECEVFKTLELPQELVEHPQAPGGWILINFSAKLYRFNGMLAVVRFNPHNYDFEVWVMEEYGVVSTWKLLFRNIGPVNYNANFMLRDDGAFFTFVDPTSLAPRNPTESTARRLEHRKYYQPVNAYAFEESLFLMDQEKPSSRVEERLVRLLSKGVF